MPLYGSYLRDFLLILQTREAFFWFSKSKAKAQSSRVGATLILCF
jgi:hypothetical protein